MNYPYIPRQRDWKGLFVWIGIIAFCVLFWTLVIVSLAHAQTSYPINLWKGLIAEDVAGGYQGMYAVACCVRNRLNAGMDHGLVAMKRRDLNEFVRREGRKAEFAAKNIVKKVFEEGSPDVTKGATHYEAIQRYGMPKWARGMIICTKISEHTFFKK